MGIKQIVMFFVMGLLIASLAAFTVDDVVAEIWELEGIEQVGDLIKQYLQQTDDLYMLEELQNVWNYFDSEGCFKYFMESFYKGVQDPNPEGILGNREILLGLISVDPVGYYLFLRLMDDPEQRIIGARDLIAVMPEFDRGYQVLLFAYLNEFPFDEESQLAEDGARMLEQDIPLINAYYAKFPTNENALFGKLFTGLVAWDLDTINLAMREAIKNNAEWVTLVHQYLHNTFGDHESLDAVILNFADLLYAKMEMENLYRDEFFELAKSRVLKLMNREDWEDIIAFTHRYPLSKEIDQVLRPLGTAYLALERFEELREIAVDPDFHHDSWDWQEYLTGFGWALAPDFYRWLAETYPDEPQHHLLLAKVEEDFEIKLNQTRLLITDHPDYFAAKELLCSLYVDAFLQADKMQDDTLYFVDDDLQLMETAYQEDMDNKHALMAAIILAILNGDQEEALARYIRADGLGYGIEYAEQLENVLLERKELDLLWKYINVYFAELGSDPLSQTPTGEAIDKFCDYLFNAEYWDSLIAYLEENPGWLERESQQYSLASIHIYRLEYDAAIEVLFYMLEKGTIGLQELEMLAYSEPEITIHPQWKLLMATASDLGSVEPE